MKKIIDKSEIPFAIAKILFVLLSCAGLYTLALHWNLNRELLLFIAFNILRNISKRI